MTAVLAVAGVPVIAVARSVRDIPHRCPCAHWMPPDYTRPPHLRAWTLIAASPHCPVHGRRERSPEMTGSQRDPEAA